MFKKFFNLLISNFCPILTEPIFPDLIRISSTVKSEGISSSYSEITLFPHFNFFSKFKNLVCGSINFSSKAAAIVKV